VIGLAAQRGGDRRGDAGRVVAAGQAHGEGLAAGALGERRDGAAVGPPDDQVALPVAGLQAVLDGGRALRYRLEIAQRTRLSRCAAPWPAPPAAPRQMPPAALGQPP